MIKVAVELKTEHPHITKKEGVCGGSPIIEDTRISVRHIAVMYKAGESVENILNAHPHLNAAQVYDAISYYIDHMKEIEQEIEANQIENVMKECGLELCQNGILKLKPENTK